MKALKTLLVGALLALAGNAMADDIMFTAEDLSIEPGKTAELKISLENSVEVVAWSFKVYLPDGFSLAYTEKNGAKRYTKPEISDRHDEDDEWNCGITETVDGGWLVKNYNDYSSPISGESGLLVTLTIQAPSSFDADLQGQLKECATSTSDAVQTNQEGNVTFKIVDPTATGINSVNLDAQSGKIYNLNGQRVEKAQNGIYIQNGKKVVVK